MIMNFLRDDSGAVTVDFVVLTAGIVGLGIATTAVVSGGVGQLSNGISSALSGMLSATVLVSNDFSNGNRGDWIGGVLRNFPGFGDVLVVESGELASIDLEFPAGSQEGILTFDVIAGDSIDYESAFFFVDGELVVDLMAGSLVDGVPIRDRPIGQLAFDHANSDQMIDVLTPDVAGITVTTENLGANRDLGADEAWRDSVTRVTVRVDRPPTAVTFAATSNTDQPIDDEFFAIDNFSSAYR